MSTLKKRVVEVADAKYEVNDGTDSPLLNCVSRKSCGIIAVGPISKRNWWEKKQLHQATECCRLLPPSP